jgi:steroid 5-alpha reductase family enzyme
MSVLSVVSILIRRNDIADVGWGIGFIVAGIAGFVASGTFSWIKVVALVLIGIWGIRLASHIFARFIHHTEDKRYVVWREQWGKWFYLRSYIQIYVLQGILMWIVGLPVAAIVSSPVISIQIIPVCIGVAIWIFGFVFESIGDAQLAHFLAQPENKGMLMTRGLWAYTRHPNYFGEVSQWWGIWIISLAVAPWYVSLLGPFTITFLILFVSGIPMTERAYAGRTDFELYKKQTSAFIPWFRTK